MPPAYRYRESVTGAFTDVTSYFRLYALDVSSYAEEGSVATSTVVADDPDATANFIGHRGFTITEDTATGSNTRIYTGYLAEREVRRGDDSGLTGASRVWTMSVVDLNSVLSRRIFDLSNANRPAETDVARIQWALGREEAYLVDDSTYLSTANAVAMDANDYRGQTLADLINDCAQQSGKNWFLFYKEDVALFSLWYDFASSENYRSPLRLSNVLADVDDTWTFYIGQDSSLKRDPSRVVSGVYLPYDGGAVYERAIDTADAFANRDAAMPSYNVKSSTKASARAGRYLIDLASEEDTLTVTTYLPLAKVNFLKEGMAVQVKASHLPGYESFYWGRVVTRQVQDYSEEFYKVTLEVSMTGPAVPDTGDQTTVPEEPSLLVGTLQVTIPLSGPNGSTSEADWGDTQPNGTVYLYDGCQYRFDVTIVPQTTATLGGYMKVQMGGLHTYADWLSGSLTPINSGGGYFLVGPSPVIASFDAVMDQTDHTASDPEKVTLVFAYTAAAGHNARGSSAAANVYYVSGPDPRF